MVNSSTVSTAVATGWALSGGPSGSPPTFVGGRVRLVLDVAANSYATLPAFTTFDSITYRMFPPGPADLAWANSATPFVSSGAARLVVMSNGQHFWFGVGSLYTGEPGDDGTAPYVMGLFVYNYVSGVTLHNIAYDPDAMSWLRVVNTGGYPVFSYSANGTTWIQHYATSSADFASPPLVGSSYVAEFQTQGLRSDLNGRYWDIDVAAAVVEPPDEPEYGDPGYDPVGTQPADVPDNFAPGAGMPAETTPPECRSLLSLVQEFSLAVKRAVRITGPSTIAMVDPNVPLPTGWYSEDSAEMFTSTEHAIQAGGDGVSYAYADLDMSASATLVRDDVRLLMSTWRIPDRAPAYELDAAPVKRITHAFTPASYVASLEYHVPVVPDAARRP